MTPPKEDHRNRHVVENQLKTLHALLARPALSSTEQNLARRLAERLGIRLYWERYDLDDPWTGWYAVADGTENAAQSHVADTATFTYPAGVHCVTISGKWRRLEDGRIQATYMPAELLWSRAATGYEPSAEELALMAQL